MRNASSAICWVGTATILACASVARAQSPVDDLRNKLHRQVEVIAQQGYGHAVSEVVGRIPAGESRSFAVQLVSGVANAIIAACGQNCDHVEIALYDHQRKPLGRTPERQNIVALNGNPPTGGLHEVVVSVPGCHTSECEIGLVVMRQGSGPQGARDGEYRRYENRDLDGGDIAKLKNVPSEQNCVSACKQNESCRAYSFDKWNRYCFLKSEISALRLDPRSVAGTRDDLPAPSVMDGEIKMERYRGRAFPGSGYKTVGATQFSTCEDTCRSEDACVAYTFAKNDRTCRLYRTADEYMPNSASDSGGKVQETRKR